MNSIKSAVKQTLAAALLATVFALFSASLFAVFVRAYAPSDTTVAVVDRVILGLSAFFFPLLCIRRERALFKGAAAGTLFLFLTTLIFGLIGGFHFSVFFLAEILMCALLGALGALSGVKIRKE